MSIKLGQIIVPFLGGCVSSYCILSLKHNSDCKMYEKNIDYLSKLCAEQNIKYIAEQEKNVDYENYLKSINMYDKFVFYEKKKDHLRYHQESNIDNLWNL